jgi:metal-responsive CopG/Arc/MetJ family transcriptional regulator
MRTGKTASAVIPGYTSGVKTAISVPDEIFDRVSQRCTALRMTRSAFFARAAQRYLDELDAESLSAQIDTALEIVDAADDSQDAAVAVGRRFVNAADDDW